MSTALSNLLHIEQLAFLAQVAVQPRRRLERRTRVFLHNHHRPQSAPDSQTKHTDARLTCAEGDGDSDAAVAGDDEPIVKMTQILASINTLGLEMNKQVNFKKLLSRSAISRRNIQMRLMHKPRSA